jgi:hypothetical protein
VLYDHFCSLAGDLKAHIKTENDLAKNETKLKEVMSNYIKYFPASQDIREFDSHEFISLDVFMQLYQDTLDIELDEDHIWPYEWPINV